MRIDTKKLKRLLLLNFPYIFVGLIATNLGKAGGWRKERIHRRSCFPL